MNKIMPIAKTSHRQPLTAPSFPEEVSTPAEAIRQAIVAADYADQGAPYDPFLMKFAQAANFTNIWSNQRGDYGIQFYQYNASRQDGFLPLGDFAVTEGVPFGQTPIMLLGPNPAFPDALAHPIGFQWILDDAGSGNSNDIDYWWPIAPATTPGGPTYQALGICISNSGTPPNPENYWLVNTDYLMEAGVQQYWSDEGQRWKHHNGNLCFPVVSTDEQSDVLVLAPTTMLSNEWISDCSGVTNAFTLIVSKLMLPVPQASVPQPVYADNAGSGSTTAQGISNVAVLPCNVISDANVSAAPQNSPFYYLAGQPFWQCTNAFPSPDGGVYSQSYTVGTSTETSNAFEEVNSVTVSADVGIEAGESGGLSAHMSVSYTHEMSVTTSTSVGQDTQTSETLSLNLPVSDRVLVWQKNIQFTTYRAQINAGGTPNVQAMSMANYQDPEITFTPKP